MRAWLPALVFLLLPAPLPAAEAPAQPASSRLYQTPRRPAMPSVKNTAWPRNPIDRFILSKLEAKRLAPTRPADRLRLLRRVTVDLTGLPPTVEEQQAFLTDTSPDAYARVVDRLLNSSRFGERWAQHWLDLVRYAESDGFNQDAHRPDAYRYRDWVIRAINANMPYDQFISWQLAGDELAPKDPDALIATGFNRLWPDEHNAANLEQRRQEILDDTTDTAGFVFLGLTVGCARCHDHKYDPTTQRDYFRLQSFFAGIQPRNVPIAEPSKERLAWESATASVRAEIDKLIGAKAKQIHATTLLRFNPDIQAAVRTPPEKRTPLQWQIALMALGQAERAAAAVATKLSPADKKRHAELQKKLAAFGPAPAEPPRAMAVLDIAATAPPTHRLIGGDWRKPAAEVKPGFPSFLGKAEPDMRLPVGVSSTGRRAAFARWLTQKDHPLTARVMVNRLWQHHFGVGIVPTASDFGAQGTPPTHPELLDWLAVELVESGWDLKHMHRLMVLSAAYCQDSVIDPQDVMQARGLAVDRDNDLLWRARRRRLEGEAIRDAVLSLSGELTPRMFGPSAKPELPANISKYAWKPDAKPADRNRRSVYVMARRNLRFPLFDAFDLPDMHNSCSRRLQTTTAPQALTLLNGDLTLNHARAWAKNLLTRHGSDTRSLLGEAYRAAWSRLAEREEIEMGERFLTRQSSAHRDEGATAEDAKTAALTDFCHAVLNTNEFVYVD